MPVKSTRFKTQTIFDGEITGLNEREKNVLKKAGIGGTPENVLVAPTGLTKTKLVGVGSNGQENIEIGDNLTLTNGKLSATGGSSGGEGGIIVIELTDKNGTIASTQLGDINANPQNFSFKYNGKILSFTKADSTTYQYCNNTTNSSDNNVMTTSTLLTITSNTGSYTIADNVHNVVANSIHPANGGDLTNIQVGSKVYSIPSGGGGVKLTQENRELSLTINGGSYKVGDTSTTWTGNVEPNLVSVYVNISDIVFTMDTATFITIATLSKGVNKEYWGIKFVCIKEGTISRATRKDITITLTSIA